MKTREEKFWQEGMDGKRFALCLFRRIWLLPAAGAAGAAAAAGLYLLAAAALGGKPRYEAFSQYRIYFDSEKYGEIQDYYNAYTWGDIIRTDEVLDYVMEALPESITRDQVRSCVTVGQMNDVRIMPLSVTTQDAALSETISAAYGVGLPRFAEALEGLTGMECWRMDEAVQVPRATRTGYALGLGFFLGAAAAGFALCFRVCLDDSVYLEEDLAGRYDWPVLGTVTRGRDEKLLREFRTNWERLIGQREEVWLAGPDPGRGKAVLEECLAGGKEGEGLPRFREVPWPLRAEDAAHLREGCMVLLLPWGARDGRLVRHMVLQLEKHQAEIAGTVVYDASDRFLRAYYGGKGMGAI